MLFNSKSKLYFQLLDRSIRYMAVDANQATVDKGELVFNSPIIEDRRLVNMGIIQARLEALIKDKKWRKAKVYVALSNSHVVIREEKIPGQLLGNEIREYICLHINSSMQLPIDDPVFDYQVFEESNDYKQIVLIAYPKVIIEQYRELLETAGLNAEVADLTSLSLYRLAENQNVIKNGENDYSLILHWTPNSLGTAVFHKDRQTFNRESVSNPFDELWTIDGKGNLSWAQTDEDYEMMIDDQLREIEHFLSFYRYSVLNGENTITQIILTGDIPNLMTLKSKISERFNIPVTLLKLPDALDQRYATLYGLTLKEEAIKVKMKVGKK